MCVSKISVLSLAWVAHFVIPIPTFGFLYFMALYIFGITHLYFFRLIFPSLTFPYFVSHTWFIISGFSVSGFPCLFFGLVLYFSSVSNAPMLGSLSECFFSRFFFSQLPPPISDYSLCIDNTFFSLFSPSLLSIHTCSPSSPFRIEDVKRHFYTSNLNPNPNFGPGGKARCGHGREE